MTIFAGIYACRTDKHLPDTFISELRSALSRYPDDEKARIDFGGDGVYLAKIDIGALGEPGEFSTGGLTSYVAGDPLLQDDSALPGSRLESLEKLATSLAAGRQDVLRACRGTFCAVVYEHAQRKLYLMTDKLGVRPLYIWVSPDYIVFSTALRILEALSFCKKTINLQGVAEVACFGYPLSDRTPYEHIYTLHAGEIVSCGTDGFKRQRYWRWDDLPAPLQLEREAAHTFPEQLYRVFIDAVRVRLRNQRTVAALLSGGLDSRTIVAALKASGVDILAANLSMLGSQDYVFGQMVADRLRIHFSQLQFRPLVEGDPYGKAAVRDWLNSVEFLAQNPQRPNVIWTGDGGSLGLGHIYLNVDVIQAARRRDLQKAIAVFMTYNRWGIQVKLLKQEFANIFTDLVNKGISAEIGSIHPADPGRTFYLFLLLNDQRRHMFNHFENMDLTRIEFEMPFYDADFITEVVHQPIDSFLYHNFYLEWLKCFPSQLGILEVPWQAYPNHVPCPLPQPDGLTYQWDRKTSPGQIKERQQAALKKAKALLHESSFSKKYLNDGYVRLLILLLKLGKADRSYLLHVPSVLYRYWLKTN